MHQDAWRRQHHRIPLTRNDCVTSSLEHRTSFDILIRFLILIHIPVRFPVSPIVSNTQPLFTRQLTPALSWTPCCLVVSPSSRTKKRRASVFLPILPEDKRRRRTIRLDVNHNLFSQISQQSGGHRAPFGRSPGQEKDQQITKYRPDSVCDGPKTREVSSEKEKRRFSVGSVRVTTFPNHGRYVFTTPRCRRYPSSTISHRDAPCRCEFRHKTTSSVIVALPLEELGFPPPAIADQIAIEHPLRLLATVTVQTNTPRKPLLCPSVFQRVSAGGAVSSQCKDHSTGDAPYRHSPTNPDAHLASESGQARPDRLDGPGKRDSRSAIDPSAG